MIIVVEGPNGSGKSTLIQHLRYYVNLTYHHPGSKPKRSEFFGLMEAQDKMINTIHDRVSCISQMAYHYDEMTIEEIRMSLCYIESLVDKKAIFIYCKGDLNFTNKVYYPPGHFEEVKAKREGIVRAYDQIFSYIPHFLFNPKTTNYREVMNYVADKYSESNDGVADIGM